MHGHGRVDAPGREGYNHPRAMRLARLQDAVRPAAEIG